MLLGWFRSALSMLMANSMEPRPTENGSLASIILGAAEKPDSFQNEIIQ
jgi:hypothetical protein